MVMTQTNRRDRMTLHAGAIPASGDVQQIHVPPDRLNTLIVGVFERAESTQHVCDLPDEKTKVAWLDPEIFEAKQRLTCCLVLTEGCGVQVEPGKWDPPLDAAVKAEQFDVHVHCIRQ